jgi:arylsulfatase A-like enzyme
MIRTFQVFSLVVLALTVSVKAAESKPAAARKPNVVVILADDLGYGDVGCYGATKVKTPNIDKLASEGLRCLDGHASSSTCTPSRYALLTGEYPWRKAGTGVLPGNASLIIDPGRATLPAILRSAGYATGAVGKWHLGLGTGNVDWNGDIKPGPLEIGFDYCFIMPATGDRVPCVYVENHRIVGLDPADPIQVSYGKKIGDEPTGKENPGMLKMKLSAGHDQTIVNGISRIGFMSGGKAARWNDEDMADRLTQQAIHFMEQNKDKPFFLYFATHDIHVPRVPHARWRGTSGCGVRGDVIQQLDGGVGEVMKALDRLKLAENTLLIFTSDNGPVVDDGYADGAVRDLNGHEPAGPLRGTKYTIWEGGTRVPWIARWPGRIKAGTTSSALICQIDLLASLADLAKAQKPEGAGRDSQNVLAALLGEEPRGRERLVEHSGGVALRDGAWKFVPPGVGRGNKEGGPQLFDLSKDLGEKKNVAGANAGEVDAARKVLQGIRGNNTEE